MAEEPVVPQPFELDGRKGLIVYLKKDGTPTNNPQEADRARVVYNDGGRAFFFAEDGPPAQG